MRIHPLVIFGLLVMVCLSIGVALLQFRFTSSNIPRTKVNIDAARGIHPLDQVLLDNLSYLSRRDTFDVLFVPEEQVSIEPFYLQRCQVSQGEFNRFAQWAQFNATGRPFAHPHEPQELQYRSSFLQHKVLGKLKAPVSGVNYYQAYAYCRAAGGRLPTSAEWEAAASGSARRIFPWGDEFNSSAWKYRNPLLNVAQDCGTFPQSNTPNGLADMGNGVSEWVSNGADSPQIRGGNALNKPYALHALNLVVKDAPADFSSQFVGFRCAFDAPSIKQPWNSHAQTVHIAGGLYWLGTPSAARLPRLARQLGNSLIDLAPLFEQTINNKEQLEVSTYEITVAQYAGFLRDPLVRLGLFANAAEPSGHSYRPLNWKQQKRNPDHPVVGISWWDAFAFARWAGGRLPTLEEWNRLFTGSSPRLYPWGDDYQSGLAIVREDKLLTAPVAVNTSRDRAPTGVLALAGNVSEWTSSVYFANQEHSLVIKGGNYLLQGREAARLDYIARAPAYHRSAAIGFRVVFN